MKRLIAFIICLALCASGAAYSVLAQQNGGNGSDVAPDLLSAGESVLSAPVAGENGEQIYKLNGNVTITSAEDDAYKALAAAFELVANEGAYAAPATKTVLDGQNFTITTSIPLFKRIGNCEIKNLKVVGNITVADAGFVSDFGANAYGTIAAVTYGNVAFTNVTVDADLTYSGATTYGSASFGGFVGMAQDATTVTLTDCTNNGDITLAPSATGTVGSGEGAKNCAGGFFGRAGGVSGSGCTVVIDGCVNNGNVSVTAIEGTTATDAYAGGLVGHAYYSTCTVTNSVNNGDIYANNPSKVLRVAGFLGHSSIASFTNCVNTGDVYATDGGENSSAKGGRAAGFVNQTTAGDSFNGCINVGDITLITARTGQPIGGIAAYASNSAITFVDCINTGKVVRSISDSHVGTILGQGNATNPTYTNCYSLDIDGCADKVYDAIIELSTVFTVSGGTNAVFSTSVSKAFYGIIEKVANATGLDVSFGGIVTLKSYETKIGAFDHESFDAFYAANKTAIDTKAGKELGALYMNATFTDRDAQTLTNAELSGDNYVVTVRLDGATANVNYVAKTFVKIGNAYIYSSVPAPAAE